MAPINVKNVALGTRRGITDLTNGNKIVDKENQQGKKVQLKGGNGKMKEAPTKAKPFIRSSNAAASKENEPRKGLGNAPVKKEGLALIDPYKMRPVAKAGTKPAAKPGTKPTAKLEAQKTIAAKEAPKVRPVLAKVDSNRGIIAMGVAKVAAKLNEAVGKKDEEVEPKRRSLRLAQKYANETDDVKLSKPSTLRLPWMLSKADAIHKDDPLQGSVFATDIFNYLKFREEKFTIRDYMQSQPGISRRMRAMLVDWLVEVHDSFEMHHETLYLSVKLVDLYLSKTVVVKDKLQLVGTCAAFIAAKYEERFAPSLDEYVYICDGAYKMQDILNMETAMLSNVGFELGIPLSYIFLRRYARCINIDMELLTLARYVLEYCLMDYNTVLLSDSKRAAAALYIALKTDGRGGWTKTLIEYTGYTFEDIKDIVIAFNNFMHEESFEHMSTIRKKYENRIFFEVSTKQLLETDVLLANPCEEK